MVVLLLLLFTLLLALACGGTSARQVDASAFGYGSKEILGDIFEVFLRRRQKVELERLLLLPAGFSTLLSTGIGIR